MSTCSYGLYFGVIGTRLRRAAPRCAVIGLIVVGHVAQ
jgi:hypothetical protein